MLPYAGFPRPNIDDASDSSSRSSEDNEAVLDFDCGGPYAIGGGDGGHRPIEQKTTTMNHYCHQVVASSSMSSLSPAATAGVDAGGGVNVAGCCSSTGPAAGTADAVCCTKCGSQLALAAPRGYENVPATDTGDRCERGAATPGRLEVEPPGTLGRPAEEDDDDDVEIIPTRLIPGYQTIDDMDDSGGGHDEEREEGNDASQHHGGYQCLKPRDRSRGTGHQMLQVLFELVAHAE